MRNDRATRFTRWIPAVIVAALAGGLGASLLSGCAGYRLGTTLPAGISRVHVPTFINNTAEPLIETVTTRATIQRFQQDGTVKVAGLETADARIDVTLVRFTLEPLRYDADRNRSAEEYRMRITADLVFTRLSDQRVLMSQRVQGDATFDFAGDMASSKATALPSAADDLARDIVESVVEFW